MTRPSQGTPAHIVQRRFVDDIVRVSRAQRIEGVNPPVPRRRKKNLKPGLGSVPVVAGIGSRSPFDRARSMRRRRVPWLLFTRHPHYDGLEIQHALLLILIRAPGSRRVDDRAGRIDRSLGLDAAFPGG
jgi:hypothetical protein